MQNVLGADVAESERVGGDQEEVADEVQDVLVEYRRQLRLPQRKPQPVLIFNQNVLDFVSCFFLVTTYAFRLCDVRLDGTSGFWLCVTLWGEGCSWAPYVGSLINLAAITVERYVRVVRSVWARETLRAWMIYATAAFSWIAGIVFVAAAVIPTTAVLDGACYTLAFFETRSARAAFGVYQFLSFYVVILAVFVVCYARILVAVRRQASVMAGYAGPGPGGAETTNKMQMNVVRTMLLVSVLFAVSWTPASVYSLVWYVHPQLVLNEIGLYTVAFMGYLYVCTNPFVYATKFEPVKRVLLRMRPCNNSTQPLDSVEMT